MQKRLWATAAIILVISFIYSLGWYFQSRRIADVTQQLIIQVLRGFTHQDAEFAFSGISVTGFPFHYDVHFIEPRFNNRSEAHPMDLSADGVLTVTTGNLGDYFTVTFPDKITLMTTYNGQDVPFLLQFTTDPVLNIGIEEEAFLPWVMRNVSQGQANDMAYEFRELKYEDSGLVVTDGTTGEALATVKKLFVSLNRNSYQKGSSFSKIMVAVQNAQLDKVLFPKDEDGSGKKLGNVNVAAEISAVGPSAIDDMESGETNIKLDTVHFNSGSFDVDMQGAFTRTSEELLPYGDLQLQIRDFPEMVDYFTTFLNWTMQDTMIPLFKIKPAQSEAVKVLLGQVASETAGEGKNIKIVMARKPNEELHVGGRPLTEVLKLFKQAGGKKFVPQSAPAPALPAQPRVPLSQKTAALPEVSAR